MDTHFTTFTLLKIKDGCIELTGATLHTILNRLQEPKENSRENVYSLIPGETKALAHKVIIADSV